MALAKTLQDYLDENHVDYRIHTHPPTPSAARTAAASHVSGEKIAKGVLLREKDGYTLAVLPASHHVGLSGIERMLAAPVSMASEQEISEIFTDCEVGAVPPVGPAYGLDMLVDESLAELDEVYFEGGDHATLVRVGGDSFDKLMAGARRARFAEHD